MSKYFIAIALFISTSVFIGCGASKQLNKPMFEEIDQDEEEVEKVSTTNGISIHGMNGPYPKTYKDKQLGQGLFNRYFFDMAKIIITNIDENINNKILINITTKSNNPDVTGVVNEGKKFFKHNKNFAVWQEDDIKAPDVTIKIKQNGTVKFTIAYASDIFSDDSDKNIDIGWSINEVANESSEDWSTIKIKNKNDEEVIYKVMKNAVIISEYNPAKRGDKPAVNVRYANADDYCFKAYGGYVVPLYIFEYALRQGSIKSPSNGVSQEMISGFDDENEDDISLYKDGDIVKADMDNDEGDFSEIVVFNHKSKRYSFKRDDFISQSVTFRCAK